MMILAFLAAAAAAAPAPQPTELSTFQDWIVGCDNGRACRAVGLMPEDWPDEAATMVVDRAPEAGAAPAIAFAVEGAAAALEADGRRLPVVLAAGDGEARVAPADVPKVVAALRSANQLRILGRDGATLGTMSLRGASAALLYMDDRQQRAGTVTALVRPGAKPASAVPAPPPLPVVNAAPLTTVAPIAVGEVRIKALRREHGCTIDEVGGPDSAESHALGPNRTLILLACGSGAYNVSMVPLIAERRGRAIRITLASFDARPGWGGDGLPMLVNADWDARAGLLGGYAKGRGLGDCGTLESYAWDGSRFRLVELKVMEECRGSTDYITTWRARVVR